MQELAQSLKPEITALIEETVRELMTPFGLRQVTSRADIDHDGDPVIRVEAHYDLNDEPIDIDVMARLALHLPDRLREINESRFPHIRHFFDEKHPIKKTIKRARRRAA